MVLIILIMTYKYIIVTKRPANAGEVVACVNVSNLNKNGIKMKWNQIDAKFPNSKYISCVQTGHKEMREFINEP